MKRLLLVCLVSLISGQEAETELCYGATQYKTLSGATKQSGELVPIKLPQDYMGSTDRVSLVAICRCTNSSQTNSDGNHLIATKYKVKELPCAGKIPNTNIPYNLTSIGTCFAGGVRESQQRRRGVSGYYLEVFDAAKKRSIVKEPAKLGNYVFKKHEFKIGDITYGKVCNQDFEAASSGAKSLKSVHSAAGAIPHVLV